MVKKGIKQIQNNSRRLRFFYKIENEGEAVVDSFIVYGKRPTTYFNVEQDGGDGYTKEADFIETEWLHFLKINLWFVVLEFRYRTYLKEYA